MTPQRYAQLRHQADKGICMEIPVAFDLAECLNRIAYLDAEVERLQLLPVTIGIEACMRLNAKQRKELDRYRWRPISEIHEDLGQCILIDINDPGYMDIGNNLDEEFYGGWTHFAQIPPLSHEDAERMKAEMEAVKKEPAE